MKKALVVASCRNYFDWARISISSFISNNPDWTPILLDIGLTENQKTLVQSEGIRLEPAVYDSKVRYRADVARFAFILESIRKKEFDFYCHLDADSYTMGSHNAVITKMLKEDKLVAKAHNSVSLLFLQRSKSVAKALDLAIQSSIASLKQGRVFLIPSEGALGMALWQKSVPVLSLPPCFNLLPDGPENLIEKGASYSLLGEPIVTVNFLSDTVRLVLQGKPVLRAGAPLPSAYEQLLREYTSLIGKHRNGRFILPLPGSANNDFDCDLQLLAADYGAESVGWNEVKAIVEEFQVGNVFWLPYPRDASLDQYFGNPNPWISSDRALKLHFKRKGKEKQVKLSQWVKGSSVIG